MPEPPESAFGPVTRAVHRELLRLLSEHLPPHASLLLIGGGMMLEADVPGALPTKDEDVVLVVLHGRRWRVPAIGVAESLARAVGTDPVTRKDRTSVACTVVLPRGRFLVEIIRGRQGGGGYFVSRRCLEAVAEESRHEGRVLLPPPEALAFLKAWGAVDQRKLVAAGKDQGGFHARRHEAFLADVRRLRDLAGLERPADADLLERLLKTCGIDRGLAIREILRTQGWSVRPSR